MATLLDHSYGMVPETVYGTPVTVSRHFEALVGSTHDFDPNILQGAGLRVGSRFPRSGRRSTAIGQGKLSVLIEAISKGMGVLLEQATGTATSTLVSGTTFQQNYTAVPVSGSLNKSSTWQVGVVQPTGAVDAYTYAGCTATGLEIDCPQGGIATVKADFDAKSVATATGYVAPTYPAAPVNLYTFAAGSVAINSTFTAATTTALATLSAGVAINVRSFNAKLAHNADISRWQIGSRGQPTVASKAGSTVTLGVEYDSVSGTLLRDAYLNQTPIPVILTLTGGALSASVETLQLAFPELKIDSGAFPDPTDDKTVVTNIQCSVLDNLTAAQPWYLSMRTADNAL